MEVTAKNVQSLPVGRYTVGEGLRLHVLKEDSRYWVFRYTFAGKRKEKSIGSATLIPITAAKARAREMRRMVENGVDPSETKKEKSAPNFKHVAAEAVDTFERVRRWKNAKHAEQWRSTLATYAFPILGDMPVDKITKDDVLLVLRPIWEEKTETATRVRGRIEAVLSYAAAKGYRDSQNPASWRGCLDVFLPKESAIKTVKHHKAISLEELKKHAPKLFTSEHMSIKAITFGILTAARAQEVIGATWGEIDLTSKTWTIPAERMKAGQIHRVPISRQAEEILESIKPESYTNEALVFPSPITGRRMSIDTLRQCLRLATHSDVTMHGCRSTFRDWCEENLVHSSLSERSLAHTPDSKVVRAYQRSDLLEQRRSVMQQWADAILPRK